MLVMSHAFGAEEADAADAGAGGGGEDGGGACRMVRAWSARQIWTAL